jgi:Skp family chaperone for outer membrane proteins
MAAGVMALSLAILATHRLWGQNATGQPSAPAPTTKVALLNLRYVMQHYERFKTFNGEIKGVVEPYQKKDTDLKTEGEKLVKQAQAPGTSVDQREKMEHRIKEIQRSMEDNKAEAQKIVGKKYAESLKILYLDVHNVVSRFAQQHGYEMVLQFQDDLGPGYWSPPNIDRKLKADTLLPMYYNVSLDISGHVVAALNAALKSAPAAPARR